MMPSRELIDDPAFPDIHMPPGPRLGRALGLLALGMGAVGYLFTFVPALLSPVLDLLALAYLGALGALGMVRLARRAGR